jgi:hypothetical protein
MDRVDSWRLGANAPTNLTVVTVLVIEAENGCLKFATADEGGGANLVVHEWCWYEIGTWIMGQACRPLFSGLLRIVGPIHHRCDGKTAGERGGCGA